MNRIRILTILAISILAVTGVHSAIAATLYWDGTPTTPDGASAGGAGTWNTVTANWDDGTSYLTWTNANNDTAVFAGTAGTVTLGEDITVGGITLNTANYQITGNTITLASGTIIHSTVGSNNTTDPEITSALAGTNGFTKTGNGWLGLNATSNSLSGDIYIGGGTLYTRHEALGSGDLVFTANSTLTKVYGANSSFPASMGLTVNPGITATISTVSFYYDAFFAGFLAGDTTSKLILSLGSNTELEFRSNANTFQGELTINAASVDVANAKAAEFNSLADSNQKIKIANAVFRLRNGGVSMNFANRQLEMNNNHAAIDNDSTNTNVTMRFSQNLIATIGTTGRTLTLGGVNTGNNTFGGTITNSANGSGAVSVTKEEAGKWILSGTNTYTGATRVNAGTLVLEGEESIKDTGTLNIVGGKVEVKTKEKIAVLQTNSVAVASGTYGSTTSSAENKTDTYFVGPGILYVGVDYPPAGTLFIIK